MAAAEVEPVDSVNLRQYNLVSAFSKGIGQVMTEERVRRRLAAILVADVVDYGRLMEQDEAGTLAALKERRRMILNPLVVQHQGRIVKVLGDGVIVELLARSTLSSARSDYSKRWPT